jgi:pimeloyl-ACP methyl ester carboxylesterase
MRPATKVDDLVLSGGRRLRVRRSEGHGRPLVLLHGFLDSSEGWAALAADTHRPCVAFDLPGFGGSDLPRAPRMEAYAMDIAEGLAALEIDDCTLVGHSLGGAIATALVERSVAVTSLVLLAPAGFGSIRLADAAALPGINGLVQRALPFALAAPPIVAAAYATCVAHHRLPQRELLSRVRQHAFDSGPGARQAILALARAGHAPDAYFRRRVAFDGPVAALWGEHDALVPLAHIDGLREALPQARVEVWAGMGHHPQRECPEALTRFIEHRATQARRIQRRRGLRVLSSPAAALEALAPAAAAAHGAAA